MLAPSLFRNLLRVGKLLLGVLGPVSPRRIVKFVAGVLAECRAMAESLLWCLIGMFVLSPLQLLLLQASSSLDLSLQDTSLLLCLLLQLGQVVGLRLSDCVFIESGHHFVVISLGRVQQRLHVVELQENKLKFFVALIDDFWCDQGDVWLVEKEPIGMLALEYLEVFIEKGSVCFEFFLTSDLSFAIIGCINKVIE